MDSLGKQKPSAWFLKTPWNDSILSIKFYENNLEIQVTEPTPKPHESKIKEVN